MERLKDSSPIAIGMSYQLYFQDLCKYSLKYVSTSEIAEEVVSNVFYKIWIKRKGLTIDYSIKSYLFSAVRNQCVDYLRKTKNENLYSMDVALDLISPYSTPEEEYLYYELNNEINCVIESLPPRCRKVYTLSRENGFKHKEIASMMNISIKTVESQMRKALLRLKSQLVYEHNGQL
ncbi:MAG: RNA polymerase sigma-70 factor (ECF subfamily) [Cyclobacteriaceae bacterium]|jgi:RNA polymerase sigma-70 factor (ECF subfamily)